MNDRKPHAINSNINNRTTVGETTLVFNGGWYYNVVDDDDVVYPLY